MRACVLRAGRGIKSYVYIHPYICIEKKRYKELDMFDENEINGASLILRRGDLVM